LIKKGKILLKPPSVVGTHGTREERGLVVNLAVSAEGGKKRMRKVFKAEGEEIEAKGKDR